MTLSAQQKAQLIKETVIDNPYIPSLPTKKQAQALVSPARELLFGGAAGGGKSEQLLMAALQFVEYEPRYAAIIFRRTYQDLNLEGALIPRSKEWLSGTDATWNGQDKKWTFPTGATLTFGYLNYDDDRYRYQSSEFQFIGFDELTQFTSAQYKYLFSRLRKTNEMTIPLRMRAASNPGNRGHTWVKQRFLDGQKPTREFIPSRISDNPHIDRQQYERGLEELDEETKKQLLDGDWDAYSSAFFGDLWDRGTHVISPPKEWPGGCIIDRSYDWGDSKPSATIWWLECNGEEIKLRNGEIITPPPGSLIGLAEYYTWTGEPDKGTRMLSGEQAKKIAQIESELEIDVEPGPADSSIFDVRDGNCIADEMARHGISWERADKSPGSRVNGAQRMRTMLSAAKHGKRDEPWLLFSENCRNCIRTIPGLPRSPRRPDDIDTDAEDHCYDSARYRVTFKRKKKGVKKFRPMGV